MAKRTGSGGIVFSTDKNFSFEEEHDEQSDVAPGDQTLRVQLETKGRGGKAMTIVKGFKGDATDVAKKVKTYCGTGGSYKDGEILVQGDNREKVIQWFKKNGYTNIR